nr:phosphotransferase [Kineosporia babensis]
MDRAIRAAAEAGCELLRASPRRDGRLLLTLRNAEGVEVAGSWSSDRLKVYSYGQDPKLPALAELVAEGGTVVAHRAGRRAVVRHPDGERWTKVLPEGKVKAVADGLERAAEIPGIRVPPVLAVTSDTVTLGTLPGVTLYTRLGVGIGLEEFGTRVGRAVRDLHGGTIQVPMHDLQAEIAVTERWVEAAARLTGTQLPRPRTPSIGSGSGPNVLLHRDLHDKQLLLDETGCSAGILDLDLLARGEAALDLANLLVHLELRVRQGRLAPDRLSPMAETVLSAYGADPAVRARLGIYARLTRIRLAAVYAFRPADLPRAGRALVEEPLLVA